MIIQFREHIYFVRFFAANLLLISHGLCSRSSFFILYRFSTKKHKWKRCIFSHACHNILPYFNVANSQYTLHLISCQKLALTTGNAKITLVGASCYAFNCISACRDVDKDVNRDTVFIFSP